MRRLTILYSLVFFMAGCSQPEELIDAISGSWEMTEVNSEQKHCIEFVRPDPLPLVRIFQRTRDNSLEELIGLWHPLRGLRLQNQVGRAYDDDGNQIPIKELRLNKKRNFVLSNIKKDSYIMKGKKKKWRAVRVENCEAVIPYITNS